MNFLKKVWAWLKKYWMIVVGFLLALGGIVIVKELFDDDDDTQPEIPLPDPHKAIDEVEKANEARDAKLQELAEKHQARLEELNDEQEKELVELAEKPIDEVVAWFDKL